MSTPGWSLFGHTEAGEVFEAARLSGRLHHAWLLEGPSGIGKSIVARRMAARMLGADMTVGETSDGPVEDPVAQKVIADSHPDFHWLTRRPDDKGKIKQDIPVADIRALNGFFALRPALGGWRVGVIDAMDDLNRSGANALLKTLEEPPANCLLVLINHRTQPLLPTIRSRCRTLRLGTLSDEDTKRAVTAAASENTDLSAATTLARGRPGIGLQLATPACMAAANAAKAVFRSGNDAAGAEFIKKAGAGSDPLRAGVSELLSLTASASDETPEMSDMWLELSRIVGNSAALNMDAVQTASKLVHVLQTSSQSR